MRRIAVAIATILLTVIAASPAHAEPSQNSVPADVAAWFDSDGRAQIARLSSAVAATVTDAILLIKRAKAHGKDIASD